MTVAELIAELQKLPQDAQVKIPNTPLPLGMRDIYTVRSYRAMFRGNMFRKTTVVHLS
jgi:hypothetical protein